MDNIRTKTLTRRAVLRGSAKIAGGALIGTAALGCPTVRAASTPLKIAYSKGAIANTSFYYLGQHAERFNLTIEPFFVDRYQDGLIALQSGQLQIAALGASTYSTLIAQKLTNVRVIAGGDRCPKERVVLHPDISVKNWKDYEGLKLGVPSNSIGEHSFRLDAQERGFDISKVQLVNMLPGPNASIAIKQKEIDGLIGWEPWIAKTVVSGVGHMPDLQHDYNSFGAISGLVAVNTEFAAANRAMVEDFTAALVETYQFINGNLEEHVKILGDFVGIEPEVARKAMENVDNRPYDENIYFSNAKTLLSFLHERGLTETDLSANLINFIDYSYLEKATGKSRDKLGYV